MIVRDEHGIIVQHRPGEPSYMDGGDSCHRTGMMAMSGSLQDQYLLPQFSSGGVVVRHPYQAQWDRPWHTTRDQVVPYVTGLWEAGMHRIAELVHTMHKARGWRAQNTHTYEGKLKPWYQGADVLMPDVRCHMKECAGLEISRAERAIGDAWLMLSLLWSTKVRPWSEQNNIICMCITRGKWWTKLYVTLHPDYIKDTTNYWCGWRDQAEIAEAILKRIDRSLNQ